MDQYNRCEDFLADSGFRKWVKQPDEESTHYWQTFLAEHPEKAELVRQAAELVRELSDAADAFAEPVDSQTSEAAWATIQERLESAPSAAESGFRIHRTWRWLSVAASVLIVLGLGWWVRSSYFGQPTAGRNAMPTAFETSLITQTNTTTQPQWIALPDGSSVILQKGSQLKYSKTFTGTRRSVYLTGEAYFEVTKDPAKPFVVYANGLLTKVLGTSFTVRAYGHDKAVTVTVRTGRVAVFAHSPENESRIDSPKLDGLVLTPNQRIVYEREQSRLIRVKEIVPAARIVPKGMALGTTSFVFEARAVSEVFSELEKGYNIKILYNKDVLASCRLTADLTDATLTEKLMIICKSIEAEYQVQPQGIVISGRGCRS